MGRERDRVRDRVAFAYATTTPAAARLRPSAQIASRAYWKEEQAQGRAVP